MSKEQPELGERLLRTMVRHDAVPYYEKLNQACDAIVRCNDCGALVTHAVLTNATNKGMTPCCGTRRVREVRRLKPFEWLKIRLGLIRFPYRREFLAEFARVR